MRRRAFLTERLARSGSRRPWTMVIAWLLLAVVGGATFAVFGGALVASDDFVNKPESKQVEALVADEFPGTDADTEIVVVHSPDLTTDDGVFLQRVGGLAGDIRAIGSDDVASVFSYVDLKAAEALQDLLPGTESAGTSDATQDAAAEDIPKLVSDDGHTAIIMVQLTGSASQADQHIDELYDLVAEADGDDGFSVAITGSAAWEKGAGMLAESDLRRAELVGVPIALVILLFVFGTVVAALIPVGLALVAIAVAVALTAILGQGFDVSIFALNIVTMLGLAVGIDYSLLIVSRFREEHGRGAERDAAVARTGATAGRAVLFSGGTVVFALTGMLIVPFSIFTSLGAGAIFVVAAAVVAALTLLPAALHLIGGGVDRLRIPLPRWGHRGHDGEASGFWATAARAIMRRPVVSLALSAGLLVALAIPAFGMERGIPGIEQLPDDLTAKRAFLSVQRDFSVGLSSPILITVEGDADDPETQAAVERLAKVVESDDRFELLASETSESGDVTLLKAAINEDATSDPAMEAVRDLRAELLPPATGDAPVTVMVGGVPGLYTDATDMIDVYTPIVIGIVLTLSFVLLLFAFRSLVIALTAIVMNLLSVGAAFGIITLIFQEGHLTGLLGFQQVPSIAAWLPLLMFCVLFGLSMDYQVFLLSRVREEYDRSGETSRAVVFGLSSTAGLITGAALIMVAVFGGVAAGDLSMFQQLGLGLAVAVALDATIVRVVVVPSVMAILGRCNWYLPRWLEWLPRVSVETGSETSKGGDAIHRGPGTAGCSESRRRSDGLDVTEP